MKLFLSLFGLLCLAAAGLYYLPKMRTDRWNQTLKSSVNSPTAIAPVADEKDIKEEMQKKISEYDIRRDLRTIQEIPSTPAGLEAAFRVHNTDVCELLPADEPLEFSEYTIALTPRDQHRDRSMLFPATRREFLTVGLTMLAADEKSLPTLSRPMILSYLDDHYLSIQARITKDTATSQWTLNYRPIAIVGRYVGVPVSQNWEEAIAATVKDICGLGILRTDAQDDKSQTAVLLFRFTWADESMSKSVYRHELGFLHAVPKSGAKEDEDPFEFHLITTSSERKVWHYFPPESVQSPKSRNACGIVGTIRFDEYMGDGLHPKRAATKRIETKSKQSFDLESVESYLTSKKLQGGWSKNVSQVIKGIINSEIALR